MEHVFLLLFGAGLIIFIYQIVKKTIRGLIYPIISFEGEVISRSYKTKVIEEDDGTERIEEKYGLEIRMPDGSKRNFSVNKKLYNSVKEGDYVSKEKGSLKLKKVPRKKNVKK